MLCRYGQWAIYLVCAVKQFQDNFFFLHEMTSNHLCVSELVLHLNKCHILSNLGRTDDRTT